MSITDRYLIKEFLKTSAAVLLVLLVLMVGNTLVKLLSEAADGTMASAYIWPLLVITIANYLVLFMGLSMFLGGMLAFGRLYKDAEMSAMVACGMGPADFFRPLLKVALPLAALGFVLSIYVVPRLAQLQAEFSSQAESPSIETSLRPGEFNRIPDGVFFVESLEGKQLSNAFIYSRANDGSDSVQLAASGEIEDTEHGYSLKLRDGTIYQTNTLGELSRIHYQEYLVNIEAPKPSAIGEVMAAIPTLTLMQSDNLDHIAEWQWRFSVPIGCLLLSLLAFPLSYSVPRKGAFSKMGYAILVYIVYSNFLSVARSMLQSGKVDPLLGMWWAHIPILILIFILCIKQYGFPSLKAPIKAQGDII